MNRYDELMSRFVGIAFIAGPTLMILAAIARQLEWGKHEDGAESAGEGVLLAYAVIFFVPIFITLGRMLGERSAWFGFIMTITGVWSSMAGVAASMIRIFEGMLLDAGGTIENDVWEITVESAAGLPLGIAGIFFPLTLLLLGIGLFSLDKISQLSAILLSVGGVLFALAQAGGVALELTWPLTGIALLIALAPIGLQRLQGTIPSSSPILNPT